MPQKEKVESDLHWAIRRAATYMEVFPAVRAAGKMVYTINGHTLNAEQIIYLDSRGKLTPSGIAEFARHYAEGNKS